MVSKPIQDQIWETYKAGKKNKGHPSNSWLLATHRAELDVATIEEHPLKERRIASAQRYIAIYEQKVKETP
jgi:hypothetical protein